ncbi:teichoic acid D-Ala incorporation-associated protein DltX [Enterococcus faecalis]
MKKHLQLIMENYWVKFIGRTCFYFLVIVALIYLYHYKNIDGGTFIYNEF